MIYKMLGTCQKQLVKIGKKCNKEKQDLREEIEGRKAAKLLPSLKTEQLQKQVTGSKGKKKKC